MRGDQAAGGCHFEEQSSAPTEGQLPDDDRCRLVSNELPGATLPHPNRKIAIVDVHNRAGHQYLGRHPSGYERGAVDKQNAVCRMRDSR